jgi:hypothetical protein
MDGRPIFPARFTRHVFAVAALGLLLASPTHASAIHSYANLKLRTEASLGPAWQRFLTGGAALWAVVKPPPFPSGLVLAKSNGLLVETPFVTYLQWRRNLDPTRFDHYHPVVGPELAQLTTPAVTIATNPTGQTLAPPSSTDPQPQTTVVPEPDAIVVALALGSAAFGWYWRRGLNRARPRGTS